MTVVVTGAAGQLGQTLVRAAAAAYGDDAVVSLPRAALDVTDDAAVRATVGRLRPDAIVNAAAYTNVDGAEDDPPAALAVNAFGVRALARAAADVGATLVHYSTDFVFDGTKGAPYVETDDPNPVSVYAASKLLGEWFAEGPHNYVLRVESLFGGAAAPDRPAGDNGSHGSTPVGPEGSAPGRRPPGGTLDRIADALLAGREVRAFTDRVVSPSYIHDVAAATLALLRESPPPGLYHCASTGHATWLGVAQVLARQLDVTAADIRPTTLEEMGLKAPRPKYCALCSDKLAAAGIAMPDWRDAIARYARSRLAVQ